MKIKIIVFIMGIVMNVEAQGNQCIIFAKISPKAEYFEQAKDAIVAILERTRQEPGCRVFNLHTSASHEAPTLYLYEIFDNEEAYAYHHAQAYTKEIFEKYKNWLAKPVEIEKLSLVK